MQMLVQLKELYKFGLLPHCLCLLFCALPFCVCLQYRHIKQCVRGRIGWMAVSRFPAGEGIKATMSGFRLTMITDSTSCYLL